MKDLTPVSVPFGDYLFLNLFGLQKMEKAGVSVPFGDYLFLNDIVKMYKPNYSEFPSPSGTIYSSIERMKRYDEFKEFPSPSGTIYSSM